MFKLNLITLADLKEQSQTLISQNLGGEMLRHLFNYLLVEHGPILIRSLWSGSKISWSDFVTEDAAGFVEKFVS